MSITRKKSKKKVRKTVALYTEKNLKVLTKAKKKCIKKWLNDSLGYGL